MAEACGFEESDGVLGKPSDMTHDECSCLAIKRVVVGHIPAIVSCWKLTHDELETVNKTGRIWLTIAGMTMPPAIVSGIKPAEVGLPDPVSSKRWFMSWIQKHRGDYPEHYRCRVYAGRHPILELQDWSRNQRHIRFTLLSFCEVGADVPEMCETVVME